MAVKTQGADGLGPHERKKLNQAIRQVWYRSKSRQICVKRCTNDAGFNFCEKCLVVTPKIKIDHIIPCGPIDSDGYITRLFCHSSGLQGLCAKCHNKKTKEDNGRSSRDL